MQTRSRAILCALVWAAFTGSVISTHAAQTPPFYFGVDLSYVNEMDDCGAVYRENGQQKDAYQIFADHGANLVRLRLWVNPTWTQYSALNDVIRSLTRAKALGMQTLLDFHFSDTWADPSKQIIPAEWASITDQEELGQALYNYTYNTLITLSDRSLMPDMVQVGNEINTEILRPEGSSGYPINWERNAYLLNRAILAVRRVGEAVGSSPRIVLHIAQPENVEGWLLNARRAGVTDFDIIGVSYYTGWSHHTIRTVGNTVRSLKRHFDKDVMIVETAYPWTLDSANDTASNVINDTFLLDGYPATPDGQRQFMIDLTQSVIDGGGMGVIYWEPAWVSTHCRTLWGQGSHWENATFFDFKHDNELLPGIDFLDYTYSR